MRPWFLPRFSSLQPWRRAAQLISGGWLIVSGNPAAAQQLALPPSVAAVVPARPADFLSPAFHKQRRELLRAQLLPHSVAVVFAAPVRNRANDVD